MQINPYLGFNGQCEAAFKFYEKCFGGKIEFIARFEGTPAEGFVPPEMRKQIMHATLRIGDKFLMGSDAPPGRYQPAQGMHVSIGIEDPAEAKRIWQALSDGGTVVMPLEKTFWAELFGMVVDRFGIPWMINCEGSQKPGS
jgi:PhnB protein